MYLLLYNVLLVNLEIYLSICPSIYLSIYLSIMMKYVLFALSLSLLFATHPEISQWQSPSCVKDRSAYVVDKAMYTWVSSAYKWWSNLWQYIRELSGIQRKQQPSKNRTSGNAEKQRNCFWTTASYLYWLKPIY